MISLKRHMTQHTEEMLTATLETYDGLVKAVVTSSESACPAVGQEFGQDLARLATCVCTATSGNRVIETGRTIEQHVVAWGRRVREYYGGKTTEIREVLVAMAEAATAAGDRNQRHREQFTAVSAQLNRMGDLEDLGEIRRMVRQAATELKASAERAALENEGSIAALRGKLAVYEQKLQKAEAAVETDLLTGLLNRAGFTRAFAARVEAGRPFCVLVADLNQFKKLNDTYGHLAGDQVLKSFAQEFRAQFRSMDSVARWGGDEFVALLEANETDLRSRVDAVRQWTFGDYRIDVEGRTRKAPVSAALGVATWRPGMTAEQAFAAADAAMYAEKAAEKAAQKR